MFLTPIRATNLRKSTLVHSRKKADALELVLEVTQSVRQVLAFRLRVEGNGATHLRTRVRGAMDEACA